MGKNPSIAAWAELLSRVRMVADGCLLEDGARTLVAGVASKGFRDRVLEAGEGPDRLTTAVMVESTCMGEAGVLSGGRDSIGSSKAVLLLWGSSKWVGEKSAAEAKA